MVYKSLLNWCIHVFSPSAYLLGETHEDLGTFALKMAEPLSIWLSEILHGGDLIYSPIHPLITVTQAHINLF